MRRFVPWTSAWRWARVCGLGLLCLTTSNGGAQRVDEYELKAAVVYNLLLFVTWPEGSFQSADAPIIVGVVGKDPFGSKLEQAVSKKRVNGRGVVLKKFATRPSDNECHLLYFAGNGGLMALGSRKSGAVVTVGECRDFATSGGIVQIDIVAGRGLLTINLGTARESGLQVSSKLLKVAKVINGGSS